MDLLSGQLGDMEARTRDMARLEAALASSESAKLQLEERLKGSLQENAKLSQVRRQRQHALTASLRAGPCELARLLGPRVCLLCSHNRLCTWVVRVYLRSGVRYPGCALPKVLIETACLPSGGALTA